MADYRGHVAAGAIAYGVIAFCGVVVAPLLPGDILPVLADEWWQVPAQFVVALLAALWPDVDIASRSRKLFYRLFLLLDAYLIATSRWQAAALLGLVAIIPGIGRHRGWTHRLWAAIIVPAPLLAVPMFLQPGGRLGIEPHVQNFSAGMPYYIAALVGYLSHLGADGLLGPAIARIVAAILWPVRFVWNMSDEDHERL